MKRHLFLVLFLVLKGTVRTEEGDQDSGKPVYTQDTAESKVNVFFGGIFRVEAPLANGEFTIPFSNPDDDSLAAVDLTLFFDEKESFR
jgi:hypothetical protein